MNSEKIIPIILEKGTKICEHSGDGYTSALYALYSYNTKRTTIYNILTNLTSQKQEYFTLYSSNDEKFIERLLTECRKTAILKIKGG